MVLAVTEIVLDVVSLGIENIEGLVLDFTAGAATGGEFGDILGTDGEIGDVAVAKVELARGIEDLDLERVEEEGILPLRRGT